MNNTLQNFKKLTLDNLNISLINYMDMIEFPLLGLSQKLKSYKIAHNDISQAIHKSKNMSDECWENLIYRIGNYKIKGWNLAIQILNYDLECKYNKTSIIL